MDLRIKIVLLTVASLFFVTTSAFGSFLTDYTNITTYDGYGSGTGWHGGQEDNEVEPGAATGQSWDLEGFFLSDNDLAMVGGFDFVNGHPWSSYPGGIIEAGDIFLETDDSNSYYDYVLDMDFGSTKYSVYDISGGGGTIAPTHDGPSGVNGLPWNWSNTGGLTPLAGYDGVGLTYVSGLTDTGIGGGLSGGSHNAAVVDLSFLAPSTDFSSFFTMECGNDVLTGGGGTAAVPEPATILLLGFGALAAFGGRLRKKFRK